MTRTITIHAFTLVVEERETERPPIDTDGAEVEEVSRVALRPLAKAQPRLAEVVPLFGKRAAG